MFMTWLSATEAYTSSWLLPPKLIFIFGRSVAARTDLADIPFYDKVDVGGLSVRCR